MAAKLRISSRDGRALAAGSPYCLVDRNTNALISVHRSHADAMRALVTLQQVGSSSAALGFSAAQLHEISTSMCQRMYVGKELDALYGAEQSKLINAVHTELRQRRTLESE